MDSLSAGSGLTGAQKDELMDQVKQQIAVANAQELLSVSKSKLCIHFVSAHFFVVENDRKVF